MSLEKDLYKENRLWPILIKTVHSLTMYPYHKRYVMNNLLKKNPDITPQDLAVELDIPLGEALVILHELKNEKEKIV
ncbi:hypothetical protein [[Eubacterium] cellulosolvens]